MFREYVAAVLVATVCPACSLILDFDQPLPADAMTDAVSTKTECDFGEPNNTPAEATPVTSADTGPAAICPGTDEDHDFYSFTASASPTTISISFTQRPGGDLDMKLYDATGTMIASSREFGPAEMLTCPGASPACPMLSAGQSYTFEVFPGVADAVNTYTFALSP
jgi:hypothetical protein